MKNIAIVLLSAYLLCRPALAADCIIQGSGGELVLHNSDGTSVSCAAIIPYNKAGIEDSYYDDTSHTLLSTTTNGRMFEIHPFGNDPAYARIDNGAFSVTPIVDTMKHPVTVEDIATSSTNSFKLIQRANGAWVDYTGGRLLFQRLVLSPTFLPDGRLTKTQLVIKYPFVESSLTSFTAQSRWVVKARSETVDVYSLVLADTTPVGEPYKSRLLVVDSSSNTGHIIALDEYSGGYVYLFKENIVIRAQNSINSEQSAGTLNFSGNYYVYDLQTASLTEHALGSDYDVLGTTHDRLYLGKDQCVHVEPIGNAQGAMWLLATLDFDPIRVFPID